ncbi:MAG: extracellular solute-binding protein [bacterium]
MNIVRNNISRSVFLVLSFFIAGVIIVFFLMMPSDEFLPIDEMATKVYYVDNISSAHQKIIDRFNQKYTGEIEIIPINLPFSKFSTNERKELLARALRSKSNQIDLFTVDVIWVPRFARWCQPLDSYFTVNERNQLIDHVLTSCYYNDSFYAIPLYTDISMMYYRSDIINQLPGAQEIERKIERSLTWQEFIDLHKKFKNHGITHPFYIFSADGFEGLTCSFFEGLADIKNEIFFEDSVNLSYPKVTKSLQLLIDLVHKYKMSPPEVLNLDEYQGYQYALKNNAIFIRGWPGFLDQYDSTMKNTAKMQFIKKAPLPHLAGSPLSFVYGGWNFMISKYSSKKKEALTFIRFALQEENQKLLFTMGGYIPINKTVYKDSLFIQENDELDDYWQLLQNGVHRPYMVNYTRISDIMSYYVHTAIKNKMSAYKAIRDMEYSINSQQTIFK